MTSPDTVAMATMPRDSSGKRSTAFSLFLHNKVSVTGAVVLLIMVLSALLGPVLAPFGINDTDVANALKPPSSSHWFGTDDLGRDVFSRVIIAAQVSLQVALVSVTIALLVGVIVGMVSGYVGGWVDSVFMRIVDVMFAFPMLILALAIVAVLGPGVTTATIDRCRVHSYCRSRHSGEHSRYSLGAFRAGISNDGNGKSAYPAHPHFAERFRTDHCSDLIVIGLRDPFRSRAFLLGSRSSAATTFLGADAL